MNTLFQLHMRSGTREDRVEASLMLSYWIRSREYTYINKIIKEWDPTRLPIGSAVTLLMATYIVAEELPAREALVDRLYPVLVAEDGKEDADLTVHCLRWEGPETPREYLAKIGIQ